jgi:hypothetical protein
LHVNKHEFNLIELLLLLLLLLNEDNLRIVRSEASRYFRNKKREYLKDKVNVHATNSKNKT